MIVEPGPDALVWLDGEFVPWSAASMHVSDHHYGIGVFEGVRAYANDEGAAVFRLEDHTDRLFRSARIMNLAMPERFGRECLNRAQVSLLERSRLRDAYLRPFVFHSGFLGVTPRVRGLRVRVAVLAFGWADDGAFTGGAAAQRAISLRTTSFTRPHASSQLARAKANAHYIGGILAREEALALGADDAVLLDQAGHVTETSGANLFVVRGGVLDTPPRHSVLEGVTRDTVMVLARTLGRQVNERPLTREDLYAADEVFVTGTAAEITPVREVDGRRIGDGAPGEISMQMRALYAEVVRGRRGEFRQWLTRI